jgi:hypothetical protein
MNLEDWPDPSWADSLPCSPDSWSSRIIRWEESRDDYHAGRLSPTGLKFLCDVTRPEWKMIFLAWKERRICYIWLCNQHAIAHGFLW